MTNDSNVNHLVETLDLRALVKTILKKWVLVAVIVAAFIIAAALFHFLRTPMYTASAYVSIDPVWFSTGATAPFVLQNDEIKQAIAEKFGFDLMELPDFVINEVKNSNTVIEIQIETNDPALSVEVVNYWAELAIAYTDTILATLENDLATSAAQVEEAENDLFQYLQKNDLEQLSWLDLVLLTGGGELSSTLIINESPAFESLTLTTKQRADLTELMRQKELAAWDYERASRQFLESNYTTTLRRTILNRAVEAEDASILGSILIIPVAAVVGFGLALLWILVEDWWKKPQPENEIVSASDQNG